MTDVTNQLIAARVIDLLLERHALLTSVRTAFYVWPRDGRAVVVFDPSTIDLSRVDDRFAHYLSTRLQGRRVVRTNSRGLYLQVGYDIPPALMELNQLPLDLGQQPTPLSLPVGTTRRGVLWIPLLEGVSFLVAGSTGMGKTGMVHGWIQALLHGGQAQVHAWDGKGGTEYLRYADSSNFHMIRDLGVTVRALLDEAGRRRKLLLASGATNIVEYNVMASEPLQPIVLVIDEARLVNDATRPLIAEIVERERAVGICPVLVTNNPVASDILVKTNLVTRVCFAVPSWNASQVALGMNGAEKLSKTCGRGLLVWQAHVMEFQAFRVTYPTPGAEQVTRFMNEQESTNLQLRSGSGEEDARILELHQQGKSNSAIVREIYRISGGDVFLRRIDEVKAVLAKITTTTMAADAIDGTSGA